MSLLSRLNAGFMYRLCGGIVLFVALVCVLFLVRAYRAGKAMGLDTAKLNRVIVSSATFTLLPSIGILLGVIALSGSLGTPWPWLRLSVIGALHYETQVAEAAAEAVGLRTLSASLMTPSAFSTICLLMSVCIMWGMVFSIFFNKRYLKRLGTRRPAEKAGHGFGDRAMTAMFIGLSTVLISAFYDDFFPKKVTVSCIGHRAGGSEAPENTVAGLDAAYALGATGGELDIQRTSDGYYVVNHDDDFGRTAGVKRRPSDMTLEEVRQLRVDGEPVPTLEEMLEAARGRLTLYVELKGATADRQMADDAVRIVREYRMEDSVVIISLKYDLIDYIETTWPEMNTGYLAFASFGDTASLNCDYLALEEEAATSETIDSIHSKGKKVLVWTVNDGEDLRAFLRSEADALITDELSAAREITREMESASPIERIVDGVFRMYSFRNA